MRLLMIHADRFSFQVQDKTSVAVHTDALRRDEERSEVEEVLVAFAAVEKVDESGLRDVATQAATEIRTAAERVGARRIMLYPYAHLSSDLARPRIAIEVLDHVFKLLLDDAAFEIQRAPFGYYKAFEIRCKGHPLSELAMTLVPSGQASKSSTNDASESKALVAEKTLRSEWRVYQADGSFVLADKFEFGADQGLNDLFTYEREGTRMVEEAPPHIKLMREQELADYEPASDAGNMRWYPKGFLIKQLLEQRVTAMVVAYGAMQVETPIMYDYSHPALAKYLQRFPARQYVVTSDDKEFFLRFAACFGQYMIQRDMTTSYRDLPMRLYELTHYSFRRERSGEVAGLRRLRAFTMPDMHTLVRDTSMAKIEFVRQIRLCQEWLQDVGIECVPAIRFVRSFLDDDPSFVREIMKTLGRPALVEVWDERFFYFVAKFEMNFVDTAKKAACLSTVQIDIENTERFDISYMAEDGTRQRPLLMHTSVSGSVDRNVYAILETQAMRMAQGKKASFPLWLAPIQVRILPVAGAHIEGALQLAERIPYRVDVDDRPLRISKKIRESEKEWIPYTLVVGERELSGGALAVRPRFGEQMEIPLVAFLEKLAVETAGKPLLAANTPRRLSVRPVFVG